MQSTPLLEYFNFHEIFWKENITLPDQVLAVPRSPSSLKRSWKIRLLCFAGSDSTPLRRKWDSLLQGLWITTHRATWTEMGSNQLYSSNTIRGWSRFQIRIRNSNRTRKETEECFVRLLLRPMWFDIDFCRMDWLTLYIHLSCPDSRYIPCATHIFQFHARSRLNAKSSPWSWVEPFHKTVIINGNYWIEM